MIDAGTIASYYGYDHGQDRGWSTEATLGERATGGACARRVPSPSAGARGERSRAARQLCGETGTGDRVDASVVLCAPERGHSIATSDTPDLERLDVRIRLIRV